MKLPDRRLSLLFGSLFQRYSYFQFAAVNTVGKLNGVILAGWGNSGASVNLGRRNARLPEAIVAAFVLVDRIVNGSQGQ
jgi:hypothetical protein